jgi:hypothetical protein
MMTRSLLTLVEAAREAAPPLSRFPVRVCACSGEANIVQQYDLVVIGTGTGTGASVAADRYRASGWRVAVVDPLPLGGTGALRGCDPKQVLVGAVEAIDQVLRMRGHGVAGAEPVVAWDELIRLRAASRSPCLRAR